MYIKKINDGYRQSVTAYDRCLKYCPHGSAGVVYGKDDNGEYQMLVSYRTPVAWVYDDGFIGCNGTYSMTTIKHIGAFAREFGLSYHDFKACYVREIERNYKTGEERRVQNDVFSCTC